METESPYGRVEGAPPLGQPEVKREPSRQWNGVKHPYLWVVAWVCLLLVVSVIFWYILVPEKVAPRPTMEDIIVTNEPVRVRHLEATEAEARRRLMESNSVPDDINTSQSGGSRESNGSDPSAPQLQQPASTAPTPEQLEARRQIIEANTVE